MNPTVVFVNGILAGTQSISTLEDHLSIDPSLISKLTPTRQSLFAHVLTRYLTLTSPGTDKHHQDRIEDRCVTVLSLLGGCLTLNRQYLRILSALDRDRTILELAIRTQSVLMFQQILSLIRLHPKLLQFNLSQTPIAVAIQNPVTNHTILTSLLLEFDLAGLQAELSANLMVAGTDSGTRKPLMLAIGSADGHLVEILMGYLVRPGFEEALKVNLDHEKLLEMVIKKLPYMFPRLFNLIGRFPELIDRTVDDLFLFKVVNAEQDELVMPWLQQYPELMARLLTAVNRNYRRYRPLMYSLNFGSTKFVEHLLGLYDQFCPGAKIDNLCQTVKGQTVLIKFCGRHQTDDRTALFGLIVEQLRLCPTDRVIKVLNTLTYHRKHLLHKAIVTKSAGIVGPLIELMAETSMLKSALDYIKPKSKDTTPLHLAVRTGNVEVVRLVIEAVKRVQSAATVRFNLGVKIKGNNLLQIAVMGGVSSIVQAVVELIEWLTGPDRELKSWLVNRNDHGEMVLGVCGQVESESSGEMVRTVVELVSNDMKVLETNLENVDRDKMTAFETMLSNGCDVFPLVQALIPHRALVRKVLARYPLKYGIKAYGLMSDEVKAVRGMVCDGNMLTLKTLFDWNPVLEREQMIEVRKGCMLQRLIKYGTETAVSTVLEMIKQVGRDELTEVLSNRDRRGRNCLEAATLRDDPAILKLVAGAGLETIDGSRPTKRRRVG